MSFFALYSQSSLATSQIVIITNIKNSESRISQKDIEDFFMKKKRFWPNGEAVRFFDHREENKSREIFLKNFIKKNSREVELYWIGEKIYTGNIAPIQISSDAMMMAMVSRFDGGIGYVSSDFPLNKKVKRLEIEKD